MESECIIQLSMAKWTADYYVKGSNYIPMDDFS